MLRFADSFAHYTSASQKYDGSSDLFFNISPTGGRFGGGAATTGGGGSPDSRRGAYKNIGGTEATMILGGAWSLGSSNGGPVLVFGFYEIGTGFHVGVWIDSSGRLSVRRSTTLLGSTYAVPYPAGYHFLELAATIHDSAGEYELRLDGDTILSGSGVDTRNGGAGIVDRIHIAGGVNTGDGATMSYSLADLYVCDGVDSGVAGAPNDDFLGDVRVERLLPNGNGNSSDLVGTDADSTDNYLHVDETPPDDDTSYVESSTAGDEDTYAYADLTPAAGSVLGVQLVPRARKTDAGARTIASVTRLGTSEEDSADKTLASSYAYLPDIREADPDGNQWTISNVNAAEFGVKVTA